MINMVKKNYPVAELVLLVSSYSQDDVELLRKEILETLILSRLWKNFCREKVLWQR